MSFSFINDIDWSDYRTVKSVVIGVALGIVLLLNAIKKFKGNSGVIEPNVEFEGTIVAEDRNLVTAPLSGEKCILYHIQMGEADHEDGPWDILGEYFSADAFFLEDKSGAIALVYLESADLRHREKPEKISPGSYDCPTLPEPIWQSIQENKHKLPDWDIESPAGLIDFEIRIAEWCFMPDEQIQIRRFDNQSNETPSMEIPEDLTRTLAGIYSEEKLNELTAKTKTIFKCKKFSPLIICKLPEKRLSQYTWESTGE